MFYIFLSLELYSLRVGKCRPLRVSSAQYQCLSSETTRENSKVQGFTEGNKNLNTTILCFCVRKKSQISTCKRLNNYLKMHLRIVLYILWCIIIESEHPFPIPWFHYRNWSGTKQRTVRTAVCWSRPMQWCRPSPSAQRTHTMYLS